MPMTLTLDLPEELVSQLITLLPKQERDRLAAVALTDALAMWQQEADARLVQSLLSELDPDKEPEREAAECRAIVEEELAGLDTGRDLLSFEEVRREWEAEKAAKRARGKA